MATTNDPISDFLTRIRNAVAAGHTSLRIPSSKTLKEMAGILKDEGYLQAYELADEGPQKTLILHLRYFSDRSSAITTLRRISKPSRRQYVGAGDIPKVKNGLGIAILSTSSGVMTGGQAREKRVGGEVLCTIW